MKVTNHHRPLPPPDTRVGLVDNTVAEDNRTPQGVQAYLDGKYGKLPPPAPRSPYRGYDAELSEIAKQKAIQRRREALEQRVHQVNEQPDRNARARG